MNYQMFSGTIPQLQMHKKIYTKIPQRPIYGQFKETTIIW